MTVGLLDLFSPPPSDGTVPLGSLVDYHLQNNPEREFAVLVDAPEDRDESPVPVTYRHLALAVHRVAHKVNPTAKLPQGTKMAILTSTDTIVNIALVLGILRAGLVPFPISPRVSVAGICHLLTQTDTHHVVAGGGSAIAHLVAGIKSSVTEKQHSLHIVPLPSFEDLFIELCQPHIWHAHEEFPGIAKGSGNSVAAVLHSSGSTGLPRPVVYNQEGMLCNFVNQPPCWQMGPPGARVGLMALPTFHVMGFMTQCFFPQFSGYTPVLFAPRPSPVIPSPEVTLQALINSKCDFLLTVPAFLEAWSHDAGAIKYLRGLKGIVYAGGPLTPWIGDLLIAQGLPVRAGYGTTELGAPVVFDMVLRAPEDWVYVEFPSSTRLEFIPQNDDEGTFELVTMSTAGHKPFVVNYEIDGQSGYATKDLVLPHPTKAGLWKFVGRVDDQIVLINGEKTNPVPMESEIIKSPLVRAAVMFGRERNQTGVLIELDDSKFDSSNHVDHKKVIKQIWPFVEKANHDTSTHSRLVKRSIIFSSPDHPLPRTPKGNVSRAASLDMYKDEIEAMYAHLGHTPSCPALGVPTSWRDQDAVESWLSRCAEQIISRSVDIHADLFQQGLDSLTATLLLGNIKGALASSCDLEAQSVSTAVSQRMIFSQPTLRQLSSYLAGLFGENTSLPKRSSTPLEDRCATMEVMVAEYTKDMFSRPRTSTETSGDSSSLFLQNVVLTGTTGALGSHLLAQLLSNNTVKRVWALNRPSKDPAKSNIQRQRASFEDKLLDIELLNHSKLEFLECALGEPKLGLSRECYDKLQATATTIIHNAWQVDFNLDLQSFEPSVRGTRYLLDLALGSTSKRAPRFVFTSSVSVAGLGAPGRTYSEDYIAQPSIAAGFGYGESKYVAEKLLEVAKVSGVETCIVRLGQLTGDKASGSWSKTDWLPSMVASSISVGHLPDAVGTISWLPLDAAATTLLDICSVGELPAVAHVVHPRPVQWSTMMASFAQVINNRTKKNLLLLPLEEWNEKVAQASATADVASKYQHFPSVKIQSTVDGMSQADQLARGLYEANPSETEAVGAPRLQTSISECLSSTLGSLPALDSCDVDSWLGYWERAGLFTAN
ncbi:acetyl-CoA synthetase-like protein [Ceratobasidium sp. AG-I]|nr:acetyl-CoA synthetase-like protein [Ceratobasidium sp. AG-I]